MNGFIAKSVSALSLATGLALVGGCECYRNLVDPCYPDRYAYAARQEVCQAFVPQVNNGHILDQTVWNYHFEAGTDKLTPGGIDDLARLARRRPCPDGAIYLQTAQDVPYDPAAPEKLAETRTALDNRRAQAIQKFLTVQTADRPMPFEVVVHDPSGVGISAVEMGNQVQSLQRSATIVTQRALNVSPGPFPGSAGAAINPVTGQGQ